mmetsp:Transcript_6091/g.10934  ORF Transcript_6091/g.10934 Transcript_6091/m.10934 type:complete len:118 (+) Transcript_6091:196-549(+)
MDHVAAMLSSWAKDHESKFTYADVLSNELEGAGYEGKTGFIDKAKIQKYLPPANEGEDIIISVYVQVLEILCLVWILCLRGEAFGTSTATFLIQRRSNSMKENGEIRVNGDGDSILV